MASNGLVEKLHRLSNESLQPKTAQKLIKIETILAKNSSHLALEMLLSYDWLLILQKKFT